MTTESKTEKQTLSIFEIAADLLVKPDFLAGIPADSITTIKMVEQLLLSLGTGSVAAVEESLVGLGVSKENKILSEVGHMARTLHNSLNEFKSCLDRDQIDMSSTNLPDATDKLEAVLKMTYEAANKTMDNMELQSQVLLSIQNDLTAYRLRLPPGLQNDSFLARTETRLEELEKLASETLVAQSFQDLTGQSIKKVIKLVAELELNLVSLIKIFAPKNATSKTKTEESTKTAENGKVNQDDVDSLLSSFGF